LKSLLEDLTKKENAMKTNNIIALVAGAILLIGATAGASVYVMENKGDEKPQSISSTKTPVQKTVTYTQPRPAPLPECDDDNIVGKVVGGAAGGIAGSQIGSGNGKTAATIGGAVGGALLGGEYIPTKNVTCR
jgi:uncharacterized protein YcfJ